MMAAPANLPDPNDELLSPFWEGTRGGQIVMQKCDRCGYVRWPAGPVCPECLSAAHTWSELSPRGRLWSYAVYDRALDRAFADEVPYAVGLVEMADGPRFYGRLQGDSTGWVPGCSVTAAFRPLSPEIVMIDWVPEEQSEQSGSDGAGGSRHAV